jgi:hypothetical protein
MFPAIRDWSEALLTSAAGGMALFFGALPRVLAASVILAVGWYLGSLLARIVARLLARVGFADLPASQRLGMLQDPAQLLALATKWLVRLLALFVAFDALGLAAVTDLLRRILFWLPHLAVGMAVLVAGAYLANAASALVRGAARSAGLRNAELVAMVARTAVWAFAAIIAMHQVGVGEELVYALFAGVVALGVVAGGLAVGLGGQDIAAGLVARWYNGTRGAAGKIAAAAQRRQERREFDPETLKRRWTQMGPSRAAPLQAARKRIDRGRVPEDETFKELTIEAAQMAQELLIAKRARVVEELRIRLDISEHEETLQETVRDIHASVERFHAAAYERRKGNGSYTGAERRVQI